MNEAQAAVVRRIFDRYLKTEDVATVRDELRRDNVRSKQWTSQAGVQHGGVEFGRGALYRILRNRLYLGQIEHKGHVYDGEHEAVVSPETWDSVQNVLDGKQRRSGSTSNGWSHYLLRGIVFDDFGNSLRGTFTQKDNARRYRYYVSAPLLGHGSKTTSALLRIPAQAIEEIVEDRVRTLLALPSHTPIDNHEIASCVKRIVVAKAHVKVTINTENPLVDVSRIQHNTDTLERAGSLVTLIIAVKLSRHGIGYAMTTPDGKSVLTTQKPDQSLLRNLAQAHEWRSLLTEGKFGSVHEIATMANCDQRYIRKLLQLAYLAPDIVDAILEGRQRETLQLKHLTDPKLPLDWASQRSVLGFTA